MPLPKLDEALMNLYYGCIKPNWNSVVGTWKGIEFFRRAAFADMAEVRKQDARRIAELECEVEACLRMAEKNGSQRDDWKAKAEAARREALLNAKSTFEYAYRFDSPTISRKTFTTWIEEELAKTTRP